MGNIVRWILGIPVAAVLTVGLFVLMMTLIAEEFKPQEKLASACLLYTSPSPRDRQKSRMPSSA